MPPRNQAVSDHALIRYMERKLGHDFSKIRQEIKDICSEGLKMGATRISHEGFTYALRNGVVVSVFPGETPQSSWLKSEKWRGRRTKIYDN